MVERPTLDAPHTGKRRSPRAPSCRPHSAQNQLARARAVGLVTGPRAHTPRTHSQWVVGLNDDDNKDKPAETTVCALVASILHKGGTHGSCKPLQQVSRKREKKDSCGVGDPPLTFAELVQGHPQGCFVFSGRNTPFQQDHQTCPTHKAGTEAYKKAHGLKKRTPANVREVRVEVSKDELFQLIMVGSSSRRRFRKSAETWAPRLDTDIDTDKDRKDKGRLRKDSNAVKEVTIKEDIRTTDAP